MAMETAIYLQVSFRLSHLWRVALLPFLVNSLSFCRTYPGAQAGIKLPNAMLHPGQAGFSVPPQALTAMGFMSKSLSMAAASAPSFVPESRRDVGAPPSSGQMLSVPEKGDAIPVDGNIAEVMARHQEEAKTQQRQGKKGMPRSQSYLQMEMENSHWVDNMISDM